ncbi:MAG TPA: hypothetical protein VFP21_11200 [Solirubrobacterales bacterium]|nr:hypothetical protein [Solirubrobacterales bacterium]
MSVPNDPFEFLRKQQEEIRRLLRSPAFEAIRREQESIRKLVTEAPALEAMRKQQEEIRKWATEPRVVEAVRKTQEEIRKISESPLLEAMRKQQEEVRKLTESPQFAQMQKQQRELAELWARQPIEPFARYREDLATQAIRYAEAAEKEETPAQSSGEDPNASYFTFRSVQYVLWQMEGLLKAMEVMTAAGDAVNKLAEDPVVSPKLLALMLMIALTGELILWFARRPPPGED